MEPIVTDDTPLADPAEVRRAMEYYEGRGWTDGLPVIPVTESYLAEFLAQTDRDPADVVFAMPHLNRRCTVRLAAINAGLAGCRPEYFPVVLAAWDSLAAEGYPARGIWQSTTGTAPLLIVNGPVRQAIGLNSKGNVSGRNRWRLPADHPDAIPNESHVEGDPDRVRALNSPAAVLVVVAGAGNAG